MNAFLPVALALVVAGCTRTTSVGDLPCAEDERLLCEEHEGMLIAPEPRDPTLANSPLATLEWRQPLDQIAPCADETCHPELDASVVHESGEMTVAGMLWHGSTDPQVWFARLGNDGAVLFTDVLPDASELLRASAHRGVALLRGPDDGALLLVSRGRNDREGNAVDGRLTGFSIASGGETALELRIDTGEIWPGPAALLGSDVVLASTNFPNVQIARYGRDGQLRWRQTRVTIMPGQDEVGLEVPNDGVALVGALVDALAVDTRGRIWGPVNEGLYGFVQLEPDGHVAVHDWIPLMQSPLPPPPAPASPRLAIDGRDRPVFGFETQVVRFDAGAGAGEQGHALSAQSKQESYYPPLVQALDVDEQGRIYVGTQDGTNSMHEMLIDRISEDFSTRERFALPIDAATEQVHFIADLHSGPDETVYVIWRPNPIELNPAATAAVSIARFDLSPGE